MSDAQTKSYNNNENLFLFISLLIVLSSILLVSFLIFTNSANESTIFVLLAFTLLNISNILLYWIDKSLNMHTNFMLIVLLFAPFLIELFLKDSSVDYILFWGLLSPVIALILGYRNKALVFTMNYGVMLLLTRFIGSLTGLNNSLTTTQFIGITIFAFIMLALLYLFEKKGWVENSINAEREKSEVLLNSLLPEKIVERLKQNPSMIADRYEAVTVLFADMVGFTKLSAKLTPTELVDLLNVIFSSFDRIVEEYGLEKIKTIGDAYMAAAGIPVSRDDHAESALYVAMKIDEEVKKFSAMAGIDIQLRIGLHSGPVVAGVIGLKKTVYDLWGDTVNVAARMEHHGVPGRIQISRSTYKLTKDKFNFINRGKIEIKGKGMMNTYILIGKKEIPHNQVQPDLANKQIFQIQS